LLEDIKCIATLSECRRVDNKIMFLKRSSMQAQQRQYFNSEYSSKEVYKSMEEREKIDFLSEKIAKPV